MALQIITGDLSMNKKSSIIKKIWQIKQEEPNAIIYYLVPEHIKFDMETYLLNEIQLITQSQQAALIDIQVVSFTRLAWFMLKQSSNQKQSLSNIGLAMLIRQILEQHQEQLSVYKGQHRHLGFVDKLLALFEELYQGRVLPEALTETQIVSWELESGIVDLEEHRLAELQLLYRAFIEAIEQYQLANYQTYSELSLYLDQVQYLPHHYIIIDHHYFFNTQQYQLIVDMIKTFKQVWITLPLSSAEANSNQWQPMVQIAKDTYQHLHHLVALFELEKQSDWEIMDATYDYGVGIHALAQLYKRQQYSLIQQVPTMELSHHHLWQFETPQNEIRHISNQIHYLVTKKGYRYRDILVVARDMDRYQQIVGPYFAMNDIPYFYDHEATMSQHILVLLLEAIFNLSFNHWRYQDLMFVLKSDLIIPEWLQEDIEEARHQKTLVENILIANGYFGFRFYSSSFEWHFDSAELPYINVKGERSGDTIGQLLAKWRLWLIDHIYDSLQQWKKASTGTKAAQWLYDLLKETSIQTRLIQMRDLAIAQGKIELSRRYEQVWQVLMDTLDEFYLLYQDQKIELSLFSELLLTGLRQATYHIIPPTMDQVTITSMESPRVRPAKICFILGLDDKTLPKSYVSDSLLSSTNRAMIKERLLPHQSLSDQVLQRNQLEALIGYQLLLNATDELYISYATTVNGEPRSLSAIFDNLMKAVGLTIERFSLHEYSYLSNPIHTNQLGKYSMQLSPILTVLRHQYQHSSLLTPLQQQLLQQTLLMANQKGKDWRTLVEKLFKFHSLPEALSPQTALALFGKNISASVSKIEQYYQDPFSHFLIYGLRLKEREQYQLDSAKAGDYFHQVMDTVLQLIIQNQHTLSALSKEQLLDYLSRAIKITNEDWRFNLFDSHPRMQAIKLQMDQQLWQFIQLSQQQQLRINIHTLCTEAIFGIGANASLKGFTYPLVSGGKLTITGKIDRIDEARALNKLQVIDYKSGNKQFNLVDAYYGHDLQILTYLNVALHNYPNHQALGAFYQPMIQGYQEATSQLIKVLKEHPVNEHQLKENRLNGLITLMPNELMKIEPLVETTQQSEVYHANIKKDGSYTAATVYFDEKELELLLAMTNQRFVQAANEIQSGKIELAPYKDNPYTTSLQPQYRVISGFDATEHYHLYRHKRIKKEEIITKIQQDLQGKGE